jgi:DNA end-binding protein Ku
MDDNGYYAIAKLTMHNREYTVILRPYHRGLMLHTMYYQEEVRAMENFGAEAGEIREAELKIANQLIEALAGKFEPSQYHDAFQENLKKLIKARLEGRELPAVEKTAPAPVTDLMSALKQSLEQMGRKKPAARAEAARPATAPAKSKPVAHSRPRRKAAA